MNDTTDTGPQDWSEDHSAIPTAPEGLKDEGTELWIRVNREFDMLQEPQKLAILEQACRTVDQIDLLEEARKQAPLTATGSAGQLVIHPLIAEIRHQRGSLNSLMKSLGLPESDESTLEKAARRSEAGKTAARARWSTSK